MAQEKLESFTAVAPEGIEYLWIDQQSGELSAETCHDAQQIPFLLGTGPTLSVDCVKENNNDFESISPFGGWMRPLFGR
jgi:penicillin-binding protein 1B